MSVCVCVCVVVYVCVVSVFVVCASFFLFEQKLTTWPQVFVDSNSRNQSDNGWVCLMQVSTGLEKFNQIRRAGPVILVPRVRCGCDRCVCTWSISGQLGGADGRFATGALGG